MFDKAICAFLISLALAGCATKREVTIGNEKYIAVSQWNNEEGLKKTERLQNGTGPFQYPAHYIAAIESSKMAGSNTTQASTGKTDLHLQSAKAMGAAVAYNASKGISASALDISYLMTSLLLTDLTDAAIKIIAESNYKAAIDGSISLTKIWKDKDVVDSLAAGFEELEYVRTNVCGYRPNPNAANRIGNNSDYEAWISGKCGKIENTPTGFSTRRTENIKALKDKYPNGSYFSYTVPSIAASKSVITDIKKNLPKGWYVMYADSLTNAKTNETAKMYRIWMDGKEWAYPLPENPLSGNRNQP